MKRGAGIFTLTVLTDVFENLLHFHCDGVFDAISNDKRASTWKRQCQGQSDIGEINRKDISIV
jgi:hypothetical protein